MSATLEKRLERQKMRTEIAMLRAKEVEAVSKVAPKMEYESLKSNANRIRPRVSRTSADEEINPQRRLTGAALGRYLEENVATFRTIQNQFKHSAIGDGPKLWMNTDDNDWNEEASNYFNSDWSKDCDSLDDTPFAEIIANVSAACRREGDILAVFDDFDADDGSLRFFESDQLVNINDTEWESASSKPISAFPWKERSKIDGRMFVPFIQSNGVVRDSRGVVMAYVASNKHGAVNVGYEEASIFPAYHVSRNPNGVAKLIKAPWRLGQYRGQGYALTISNSQQDIYEMVAAELQSAKVAARNAAVVTVDPESESTFVRALQQTNKFTDEQIAELLYGDASAGTLGMLGQNHEQLDSLTGGTTVYANPGESVMIHDHERPAASVREFADWLQISCGGVVGLGRSRSTMKAESSYTAFRGEELISWAAFRWEQKFLERRVCDWTAIKAIEWAIRKGRISAPSDSGWMQQLSWAWPQMPEVDQLKAQNALRMAMKNGAKTLRDVMGPNWRVMLENYGEQLTFADSLDIPLSVFETVSGSIVQVEKDTIEK